MLDKEEWMDGWMDRNEGGKKGRTLIKSFCLLWFLIVVVVFFCVDILTRLVLGLCLRC